VSPGSSGRPGFRALLTQDGWRRVQPDRASLSPVALSANVPVLDFSHSEAKGVGYARHRSRLKEVSEMRTLPPKMVQALVPFAPLSPSMSGSMPSCCSWGAFPQPQASGPRGLRATIDGFGSGEALPSLPPGLEPCRLVEPEGEPRVVGLARGGVGARRISSCVVGIDETLERRYGRSRPGATPP
jgi:hypothetical protein